MSSDIESVMRNLFLLAVFAAIPVMAGAQNTRTDQEKRSESVPMSMMPPAGKCRIWMVGVAPAQQPAPTDCQTALRQRPTNGVVVFGPVEREASTSAFRGRPTVEQGQDDRPRTPTSGQAPRETPRDTPRTPTPDPRRASPARPPSGSARPTAEPAKKPPEVTPSSGDPQPVDARIGGAAAVMSPESAS